MPLEPRQAESRSLSVSATELFEPLGFEVQGDQSLALTGFSSLDRATATEFSFLGHARYRETLSSTKVGLIILPSDAAFEVGAWKGWVVTKEPYLLFAKAAGLLVQRRLAKVPQPSLVHPTAVVSPDAVLANGCQVHAHAVIESGAELGMGTVVGAGSFIGEGVRIGAGSWLAPRVVIQASATLGERCIIHAGAVIGADGFGFVADEDKSWVKMPQTGSVHLGDDVEVGANTTIDRGTFSNTQIGNGVKLDNLIQVAHNVEIGDHTAIAGCVGIAGSAKIGRFCQIAGAAGILGHLSIADFTVVGPMTLIQSSITKAGTYVGVFPAMEHRRWARAAASLRREFPAAKGDTARKGS